MLKNMTFKNVLDLVRWHVRLSVRVYQTDEGLIVWVPLWCPTADESRSAVFMETSCLRSSVIHKSKHRFFFLDRMCSIKQRLNITSEPSALFSQAILSQHYITSRQHGGAGSPAELLQLSVWSLSHWASSLREHLGFVFLFSFFF